MTAKMKSESKTAPKATRKDLPKLGALAPSVIEAPESSVYDHADLQCDLMYNKIVSLFKGTTEVASQSLLEDAYSFAACRIPMEDQEDFSPYDAVLRLGKVIQYVANAQMHLINSLGEFMPNSKRDSGNIQLVLPDADDCSSTQVTAHHTVLAGAVSLTTAHQRIGRIVYNVFDDTGDEDADEELLDSDSSATYLDSIRYESVNLMEKVLSLSKFMYKSGIVAQNTYESMQYGFSRFVDDYISCTLGPDAKDAQDKVSRYVSETCFAFSAYYACMYAYYTLHTAVKACLGSGNTLALTSVSGILDVNNMYALQAIA